MATVTVNQLAGGWTGCCLVLKITAEGEDKIKVVKGNPYLPGSKTLHFTSTTPNNWTENFWPNVQIRVQSQRDLTYSEGFGTVSCQKVTA